MPLCKITNDGCEGCPNSMMYGHCSESPGYQEAINAYHNYKYNYFIATDKKLLKERMIKALNNRADFIKKEMLPKFK